MQHNVLKDKKALDNVHLSMTQNQKALDMVHPSMTQKQ